MEPRQMLLQAELTKIELEAEAKSVAIMNKIDTLVAAHVLCAKINEGITCGVRFDPIVTYRLDTTPAIHVHTGTDGDVFISRLRELGIEWIDQRHGFDDQREIDVDGAPGVVVFVRARFLAPQQLPDAA